MKLPKRHRYRRKRDQRVTFGTRVRPSGGETKRPPVILPVFVSLSVGVREAVLGEGIDSNRVISGRRKFLWASRCFKKWPSRRNPVLAGKILTARSGNGVVSSKHDLAPFPHFHVLEWEDRHRRLVCAYHYCSC